MTKTKVALFGASGTMGFQAFKELWKRRDKYDISILVLPSEQGLGLFQAYEREAGLKSVRGPGERIQDRMGRCYKLCGRRRDGQRRGLGVERHGLYFSHGRLSSGNRSRS